MWARALARLQQQIAAGEPVTRDTSDRVCRVFSHRGGSVEFLRWWVLFRAESIDSSLTEVEVLRRRGMWKQALYCANTRIPPDAAQLAATVRCMNECGRWSDASALLKAIEASKHSISR
jgi:hypothetical protein